MRQLRRAHVGEVDRVRLNGRKADGRAASDAARVDFFDLESETWTDRYPDDPKFARRFELLATLIREELEGVEPRDALDFGCGSGVFSVLLAGAGWRVDAVDASPGMLRVAERYATQSLEGRVGAITFKEMLTNGEGLPPESFDLILCLSVLEYMDDDAAALGSLAAALRPGGRLVLSVPNRRSVVRRVEWLVNRLVPRAAGGYLRFQKHQYTPREIDSALSRYRLVRQRHRFWSTGFSRPSFLVPALENARWAGMYGAVYKKQ